MSKDLFSTQAADYAKYRPTYPPELYEYILSFVKEKKRAWDCATGNGQAARVLAAYFDKVDATDLSGKQIQQALPNPKIEYSVVPCDHTSFFDHSFDLITVAQAYHWFDFDSFAKEARRVGKPGAVLAIWGYGLGQCEGAAVQDLVWGFYKNTVGPYWDPERKFVEENYETIPFHFPELPRRSFSISLKWSWEDFLGYLRTWSAVQHFRRQRGEDPVESFAQKLRPHWQQKDSKLFHTPLFLRLARLE
jgi:SAM-dependent methyltransferase